MLFRCTHLVIASLLLNLAVAPAWGQEDPPRKDEGKSESKREKKPGATAEQEADQKHQRHQEVERKLAEMKRRIVELRKAGNVEEAASVEREARTLSERFNAETIERVRQQIEGLRRTGRVQEAMKLEGLLRQRSEQESRRQASEQLRDQSDRAGDGSHADLERRIAHLREAAENLVAAGMPEQADHLRRLAETMRERHGEPSDRSSALHELHSQLRQQNERIERLEQIVHRLAESLERQDASRKRKSTEDPTPGEKRKNDDQ